MKYSLETWSELADHNFLLRKYIKLNICIYFVVYKPVQEIMTTETNYSY